MSITKHYIEILYSFDKEGSIQTRTEEVDIKDPLLVKQDEFICGFRFYDVKEVTIDGETLKGEKKNITPTFYFGKRTTLKELAESIMSYPAWVLSERLGYRYETPVISCDNGTVISDFKEEDLTIDEYKELKARVDKRRNTLIERKNLFIGLTDILNTFETDTFTCREENNEKKYDFITRWSVLNNRKYSILNGENTILSNEMYTSFVHGFWDETRYSSKNIDRFIKYSEIADDIEALVAEYPYLQFFIDNIIQICQNNRGHLPLEQIIELENQYLESQKKNITLEKNFK